MTSLSQYLEKYPNSKEVLILKKILANRPTEKTTNELRQIKREEKFGKDCARWMRSVERQGVTSGRIGGER